jgi:predicted N-acetyltransferase YhbS
VLLSLVACVDDQVVGHIMYSDASVGAVSWSRSGAHGGASRSPAAGHRRPVDRQWQRDDFARTGARLSSFSAILLLSSLRFRARLGRGAFRVSGRPDDVFMLLVLDETKMTGVSGVARYRDEFSTVS